MRRRRRGPEASSQTQRRPLARTKPDLRNEFDAIEIEPLLPIEKKLIVGSLGAGLALLVTLVVLNHLFPIGA